MQELGEAQRDCKESSIYEVLHSFRNFHICSILKAIEMVVGDSIESEAARAAGALQKGVGEG
jgi:hypothetical protein